jgi:proteasome lid subunit RPN8/RPN11
MSVETGLSVRIQAEVTRQIRQHARSSMSTEVCGVLIGDAREEEGAVEIFAAIAGVNAAQAGTHVTFTQDAWEHIYKVKDAEYPEARIVGWYHSHPGFGVFLSEHDTFIQKNFFSAATQVAWVFDPHTDEEGCFGWAEGEIARLGAITVVDSNPPEMVSESRELAGAGAPEEMPVTKPVKDKRMTSRVRLAAMVLAVLVAIGLGFGAARIFFPSIYPLLVPVNPMTGQPLLHDSKTGGVVYVDPQRKRYVAVDPRSGRLTPLDPSALKAAQAPAGGDPSLQAPGSQPDAGAPSAVPAPHNDAPKEKK